MAIVFHCLCGHLLRAQADSAGKRTRCPGCNQVLTIPGATKPAGSPATATSPTPAASGGDPLSPELDWSSLESRAPAPAPAEPEPSRPAAGAIKVDAGHVEAPVADAPRPEDGSKQYRVLTQKDQGFSGKFNATKLEEMLNDYARRGWSLKAAIAMNVPTHGGHHDELVVILER